MIRKEEDRKVFIVGMDTMLSIKKSILQLREEIENSERIISQASEYVPEDASEMQDFYRQEIARLHQEIAEKKKKAKDFFAKHITDHPEAIAIFQKEYAELPD